MMRSLRRPLACLVALVALDQLVKQVISTRFYMGESVEIASFFHITYVVNTGAAFSMFQGANTFFTVFAVLALLILVFWYARHHATLDGVTKIALLLIASGAVGNNLIDRPFRGHVIDFLDFNIGSYHWPAFNVADSCITIGGILLFYQMLLPQKNFQKEPCRKEE